MAETYWHSVTLDKDVQTVLNTVLRKQFVYKTGKLKS